MTALHCGGCGKRTAEAERATAPGADDTAEARAFPADVIVHGRYDLLRSIRQEGHAAPGPMWRPEVIASAYSDAYWPLTWTCQYCGATLQLTRDQGQRVGTARRLVCTTVAAHR